MAINNPTAFARPADRAPSAAPQRPGAVQLATNLMRPVAASTAMPPALTRGVQAAARGAAHVGQEHRAAIDPVATNVPRLPTRLVRPAAKSESGRTMGYGQTWEVPRPTQPQPSASPFKGVMSDAEITAARAPAIPRPSAPQIDRVQVFSDGTGGIEQTLSRPQIDALANGDRLTTVPSAAFTRPAPGVAMSMATGGATPELGSVRRPDTSTTFSRQPVSSVRAAQLDAQHDLADIASGNMLSAQGRAASNLRRRANSGDQAAPAQLDAMVAGAGAGVPIAGQLEQQHIQEQGGFQRAQLNSATDLAREQMAGQVDLERTRLQRPPVQPTQIPLADGTLGLLGQDGTVNTATMADGTPARPAQPRQRRTISSGEARLLNDIVSSRLGLDPQTGMIVDPKNPRSMRAPTAEEFSDAMAFARQQIEGFATGEDVGQPPTQPSDSAVNYLRQHPDARADFDEKYGAGAAARILGS